jgi:hypothetical protein
VYFVVVGRQSVKEKEAGCISVVIDVIRKI